MDEEISIKVNIGGRLYPLKVGSSQEEHVRKAAKYINDKANEYMRAFSFNDYQDGIAMSALDFAIDMLNKEQHFEKDASAISDIVDDIESLLD